MLTLAIAPIEAWMALGLYRSTVSVDASMRVMPIQSAMRIMVPRLPGSCTLSRASNSSSLPISVGSSGCCGIRHTAITPCGVVSDDMRAISSFLATMGAGSPGVSIWRCSSSHACVATRCSTSNHAAVSRTARVPSITNSPAWRRWRLLRNEAMHLRRDVVRVVVAS